MADMKTEVLEEELRLAHYYLGMHRCMLENMRIGYLKRYEDSGKLFTNEKAKAEHCECDINTIDGWLKRFSEFAVKENEISHLNDDYSHKAVISFKKQENGGK